MSEKTSEYKISTFPSNKGHIFLSVSSKDGELSGIMEDLEIFESYIDKLIEQFKPELEETI